MTDARPLATGAPAPAPPPVGEAPRSRAPWAPSLRLVRLLWRVVPEAAFVAFAQAAAWLLGASPEVRAQVDAGCAFVAGWAVLRALALEWFSPVRPALRLAPMGDLRAAQAAAGAKVLLGFLLATELSTWLLRRNGAPAELVLLVGFVRDAGLVVAAALAVWVGGLPSALRRGAGDGPLGAVATVATRVLFPLAVPAALGVSLAWRLGYVPLAQWITSRVLATAGQALLAVLLWRFLRGGLRNLVTYGRQTKLGGHAAEPSPAAVGFEQVTVTVLGTAVVLATTLWALSTWGLGPARIADLFAEPVVRGGTHTWGSLARGLAATGGVLLGWRLLRTILTFFVFPGADVDVGARFAILAVLRYTMIALAAFFVLEAIGLDTGSLAWFLGAAGIGLGLGLQDVLANFFGGLLMLVERPVRVGDLIEVGSASGTVEDIRIRGTVIRTAQNTTVLVPNRQMMSERLTNLSYGIGTGLVEVRVTVPYAADTTRVEQILLRVAQRHPDIVAAPPPAVLVSAFGEVGLDLTISCSTSRVRERGQVASDLRHGILAEFRREGIRIPTKPTGNDGPRPGA